MKELTATLNNALITRIKAPFLGSFILCYISLNIRGIVSFYIGTAEERKVILSNFEVFDFSKFAWTTDFFKSFFTSDFMSALYLVCVYIVLTQFLLPMLQTIINQQKLEIVTKPYQEQSAMEKEAHYNAMTKANEAKYRANDEYIKNKYDKELENWQIEKEEFIEKFKSQNEALATQTEQVSVHLKSVSDKVEKITVLTEELSEQKRKCHDLELRLDSTIAMASKEPKFNSDVENAISMANKVPKFNSDVENAIAAGSVPNYMKDILKVTGAGSMHDDMLKMTTAGSVPNYMKDILKVTGAGSMHDDMLKMTTAGSVPNYMKDISKVTGAGSMHNDMLKMTTAGSIPNYVNGIKLREDE
ncbi:MAG: hypothetical protein ACI935_002427 [Moritella dasanensis]|jgi:hypothetical protein